MPHPKATPKLRWLSELSIAKTPASSVIGIAINAFIIWALTQNAQYFKE